jgi:hypothetical protein
LTPTDYRKFRFRTNLPLVLNVRKKWERLAASALSETAGRAG